MDNQFYIGGWTQPLPARQNQTGWIPPVQVHQQQQQQIGVAPRQKNPSTWMSRQAPGIQPR